MNIHLALGYAVEPVASNQYKSKLGKYDGQDRWQPALGYKLAPPLSSGGLKIAYSPRTGLLVALEIRRTQLRHIFNLMPASISPMQVRPGRKHGLSAATTVSRWSIRQAVREIIKFNARYQRRQPAFAGNCFLAKGRGVDSSQCEGNMK